MTYITSRTELKTTKMHKYRICPDGVICNRITGESLGFIFDSDKALELSELTVTKQQKEAEKYLYKKS